MRGESRSRQQQQHSSERSATASDGRIHRELTSPLSPSLPAVILSASLQFNMRAVSVLLLLALAVVAFVAVDASVSETSRQAADCER